MTPMDIDRISPGRALLASFDHAYALALRQHRQSGRCQWVLRTGNPWQPFRTTSLSPQPTETILALIV